LSHPEPETWGAVAMPALLNDVLDILPGEPKLSITYRESGEIPTVWGDALRLSQVFTNLIRNAIDASPEGTPVEVSDSKTTTASAVVVRNTGVGIPPSSRTASSSILHDQGPRHGAGTADRAADRRGASGQPAGGERRQVGDQVFAVELPAAPLATAGNRE